MVTIMPFDGFVTKCVAEELDLLLRGGRVEKVWQPERDEIHILIRSHGTNHRLLISANASSPRIHLTRASKENPQSAPLFCMILRKHLGGGKVVGVSAAGFERVVGIAVESANELGDVAVKTLYAEIMGKYSNVILVNEENRVIDALIHVDQDLSSVREVMPARPYAPPPAQDKLVPGQMAETSADEAAEASAGEIIAKIAASREELPMKKISAALLDTIMGASPLFCRELCHRAGVGDQTPLALIGSRDLEALRAALAVILTSVLSERYSPCVVLREPQALDGAKRSFGERESEREVLDFYCLPVRSSGEGLRNYETMSDAMDAYYDGRGRAASLKQRKAGLTKLVGNNLARCRKKLALQQESMREAANRDTYKLYGELITANIHAIPSGAASASLQNYYYAATADDAPAPAANATLSDAFVEVALDAELSPQANAQKYFKKYRKAASTWKNAEAQAAESVRELNYLESVLLELEMSATRQEIDEIRQELTAQKYLSEGQQGNGQRADNRQRQGKGSRANGPRAKNSRAKASGTRPQPSPPRLFTSSDGLAIYVGKNNRQNDQLTLRTASSNDVWLHARNMPGSHVIVKKQRGDVPERTLFEAATLAAYFSKAKMSENVNIDYTQVKNVKKPPGAKPGMVIYENHRTLTVTPDERLLTSLSAGTTTVTP
ncbi:MAG: NFACT family protein [Clostridiales bacterium]|jgi:predicted ribosome quality control (RQC) complex YloA/Tae2 family protein|nr:NFACT family protein [Clostridiales bacterium]